MVAGEETGEDSLLMDDPLGSSACFASLRSAAAKLEEGADWTESALLAAGLPLGTREPLIGEGVRGLTVAVVRVAVESIPMEADFGSWFMLQKKVGVGSSPSYFWLSFRRVDGLNRTLCG